MKEPLRDKETIKNYLLGKISDEEMLAGLEESLFTDEEFSAEAELVEDEIIEDYAFDKLNREDKDFAEKYFLNNPERQFKLKLTEQLREKAKKAEQPADVEKPAFFETLKSLFRQPAYAGAFAILIIAIIGFSIYFFRDRSSSELAQLQSIYQKERPVETRISEFGYAPLNIVRGQNEDQENINKLRRIENTLLEAVAKDPTAENRRALGIFYLTQRKFTDAIRELENAARLDGKNAKIRNDLGSAYFELAKTESDEKRLETLAKALENFSQAVELNPNLLEALFNKALCLQELRLYNQAKETWSLYLEKDANSDWANEARKYLERLENLKTTSKTKEQVLDDFLNAYRNGNENPAWKIHSQTKEMISGVWLPEQLSRRFLEARLENDVGKTRESIEALKFIGALEKTKNADFFVADLEEYYSQIDESRVKDLLKAKDLMKTGFETVEKTDYVKAVSIFEEAKLLFAKSSDSLEEKIADLWIAQCNTRNRKIAESESLLSSVSDDSEKKNYKWLYAQTFLWHSDNSFLQNQLSQAIEQCKKVLKISEEISDSYGKQKSFGCLANTYTKLGELNQSKNFLSKGFAMNDLYFSSRFQAWRDYYFLAELFDSFGMRATAACLGKESLVLALESPSDRINASLILLANIFGGKKDLSEALNFANESKNLAQNMKESSFKQSRIANSLLRIANLKREMGDCEAALQDYENALQIYLQNDETKLNVYETHKGKLLCYQELNKIGELQTELEIVLDLSEKYRSQILRDEERQAFFDNEQIVYDAAIENSLADGDAQKAFAFAESSKARSLLDFIQEKNSIVNLEEQFPDISKPLRLAEIQTRMPESVQIVQFAVLPKKTAIWVVTKSEIKNVEADISSEDLEQKVSDYVKLVVEKNADAEIKKSGKELYELLVKPIFSTLDLSKEVCLIPDKTLHKLPFASLISEDGKYLIENFKISYSPSASVFVFATEKAAEREKIKDERLLSIGNPSFDKEENANLAALPSAEEEAKKIAEFYPDKKQFYGSDAAKKPFLDELPNAEIVHFAGHYVASDESPGYSKLLFAATGLDSDLRAFEIAGTKLPKSKMVVLSACQTGIERFYKGEGAIGIARVFLAVGTPIVVASQWKVDSEATKDLMIAFHRNRREKNLPGVEALRAAQIEMLSGTDENFRQPYFWSAFSIIGGSANY